MGQTIHTQALVQMLDQQGEVVVCVVYRNTPGEEKGRLDIWVPQFDSQSQKPEFKLRPQNTHGVDFVWLGENPAVLGTAEREAITHKPEGSDVTQDVSEDPDTPKKLDQGLSGLPKSEGRHHGKR